MARGAGSALQPRIQVHEHTPFGLFGRDAPAGFQDARPHVRPLPDVGHDLRVRLGGKGVAEDEPERLEPQLTKLVQVEPGGVRAAGPLPFCAGGGRDGHGEVLPLWQMLTQPPREGPNADAGWRVSCEDEAVLATPPSVVPGAW